MNRYRYRITTKWGYNGCIPIVIYWVQVREKTFWGSKWRNVKGFDTYASAENLLRALE